jgi:hypothetical protein
LLQREDERFDFRHQVAAGELAEAAAIRRGGTGGTRAGQFVELAWIDGELAQRLRGGGLRGGAGRFVVWRRREQDVRRFVNIGRAEAAVGGPVAAAGRGVRVGDRDLTGEQRANRGFLVVAGDALSRALVEQQAADHERRRRLAPGVGNVRRGMVL